MGCRPIGCTSARCPATSIADPPTLSGRAAANRVLNRWLARTGDWDAVAGLPLFLSQRAMVRAHVQASRGQAAAARYLDAALAYLRPVPAVVVAIGGLQATGKSTLARALAPALGPAPGAVILRSDEIRKRRHHLAPEQRLPQAAYSAAEGEAVFAEIARAACVIAGAGHAVVADGMFFRHAQRAAIRAAAGRVRFVGLWLIAPLPVLEARIAARQDDASDATVEVLRRAVAADPGPGDWTAVDATDAARALAAARAAIDG